MQENLDFLEACAITGCVTFASVKPGILKANEMAQIREICRFASLGGLGAVPTDWLGHNICAKFETPDGKNFRYDGYKYYDGVRYVCNIATID